MIPAPLPDNEAERLADLRALAILDTAPEDRFERLVRLATQVFAMPVAYVALVDANRQWFKARCGVATCETPRDVSFCGHAILGSGPLVIPDARLDERFHDNPMVVGEPHVRFYAGHPLRGPSGHNIGTFCMVDVRPRQLSESELESFAELAGLAERELQLVDVIRSQSELIATKDALLATQERLRAELGEAAAYVRAVLPPPLRGVLATDWEYIASSQLGGDMFGYHTLADGRVALFLFDVAGHGVGASLLSMSVHTALARQTLPDTDFGAPSAVLASLNAAFPMERNAGKYCTLWYGVFDPATRRLDYASAAHPAALAFAPGREQPVDLGAPSYWIGMLPGATFDTHTTELAPGSRLYVFSDGAFEIAAAAGGRRSRSHLVESLAALQASPPSRVQEARRRQQAVQGREGFADDFSLLEVEVG